MSEEHWFEIAHASDGIAEMSSSYNDEMFQNTRIWRWRDLG